MPRVPVPTLAEDDNGNLFVAFGDRKMRRWDGVSAAFVDAGLTAPADALTLGTTGEGAIVGNIFAYQRFVDADGRVSNMSSVSSVLSISENSGSITDATNAGPIVITSTAHGLVNGETVLVEGVIGNRGANGEWVVANKTADTFELQGSNGTGDYRLGGTWRQGTNQIDYSGFTDASADTRIAKRQILRTKDGNANVVYVDKELTDLALTSTSSTNTDAQLGTEVALLDNNGGDLALTRHSEPPSHKRVITSHYSRMFAAVDYVHQQGVVSVTNTGTTVTGIGTNFTSEMVGWELYVDGANNNQSYTVSAVDSGNQTLTIPAYQGDTAAFVNYTLRPQKAERFNIYFSEVGLPDSFNLTKAVTLIPEPDAGEITGMMPIESRLYILFEHRIYKLTYVSDPANDGDSVVSQWRGCVNQNCWVLVERDAYLLDRQGIYKFTGETHEAISMPIQSVFERGARHPFVVNFQNTEHWHAAHDPARETIRWFVTMGHSRFPRHVLCYHYRLQRWWVEEYPLPVPSSHDGNLGSSRQLYLGTSGRRVCAYGRGDLDGVDGRTVSGRGTASSADVLSLSDASANFATSVVGLPVSIVEGTGRGQQRIISAATATKLTVKDPWSTKPDTTSVYQIGGIQWRWKTGVMRFVQTGRQETRGFELVVKPTVSAAAMSMRGFHDQSSSPTVEQRTQSQSQGNGIEANNGSAYLDFDTTKASGFFRRNQDAHRGPDVEGIQYVQYELSGVTNDEQQEVYELDVQGALK